MSAYLDHSATTPLRPEVLEVMLPFLQGSFANPSAMYGAARQVRRALDDARDELSAAVGCAGDDVIFTSGGTESDNLALLGVGSGRAGRVLVSAVEHSAVLQPALSLGAGVVAVNSDGRIDLEVLEKRLDHDVCLVSIMLVNSEVGVIQPIEDVAALLAERAPDALFHCDAVQGLSWLEVDRLVANCDLVSLSGHKFGGPKGIGALIVRERARELIHPVVFGGGQERELRSGTQNVAGAVGMARAATMTVDERCTTVERVADLRDDFVDRVLRSHPSVAEPAPRSIRVANNAHLRFGGTSGEELVMVLDELGIAASMGSACASGARDPSHVLLAMGWTEDQANEAVRFTLGSTTTSAEIDFALEMLDRALLRLRGETKLEN